MGEIAAKRNVGLCSGWRIEGDRQVNFHKTSNLALDGFSESSDTHRDNLEVLGMGFPGTTGHLLVGSGASPHTDS